MSHTIEQITSLLKQAAAKYVSEEEAQTFAELYTQNHLRKSPRMNPLQEAVDDLKIWKEHPDRSFKVVQDKQGVLILDLNGLAPSVKIHEIHGQLEKRAKTHGMAAVGLKNGSGIITLNMWADGLARLDLIGLAMFNGGTECCVPYGAKRGVLGTNPLAYAIPTLTDPVQMDMATSQIPFFDVKNSKEQNRQLPDNAAVDQDGQPTTDAAKALDQNGVANILPMGGDVKGYGIVMLIEILTGALVQSMLSTSQSSGWNPQEYGCLLLALDISSFTEINSFKKEVSAMCDAIRSLEAAEGYERVSVPGDRGHEALRKATESNSIKLPDSILKELNQLV